ncbi:hypothetical protein [Streptomyces sp. NPDC020681]|uniref:hypothetical protein n=1 Tax=Streptomyces sp. NPDC020681 TaxID=3365083 RepID=UPI00378CC0BC
MDIRCSTRTKRRTRRLPWILGALAVILVTSVGTAAAETADRHREQPAHAEPQAERLWLLGGLALSLTAAGVVAVAATRSRRNHSNH